MASSSLPAEPCALCADSAVKEAPGAKGFFHCQTCDVRFLHSSLRLSADAEAARYRTHNNDPGDAGYRAFLKPLVEAIHPQLTPQAHGLDFGCGPGPLLAAMFCELGYIMDVYDPIFAPALPSTLQRTEAQYDFISLSEVAEHMFDPLREFRKLSGWLKPGGWLCVMTALTDPPVDFASWYYRRDPTHVVFYSRRSFAWLATTLQLSAPTFYGERVILLQRPMC